MEFKNINHNSNNDVAINLINVNFFINLEIMKIEIKTNIIFYFFLKDAMIAQETKFLVLFTSRNNIE